MWITARGMVDLQSCSRDWLRPSSVRPMSGSVASMPMWPLRADLRHCARTGGAYPGNGKRQFHVAGSSPSAWPVAGLGDWRDPAVNRSSNTPCARGPSRCDTRRNPCGVRAVQQTTSPDSIRALPPGHFSRCGGIHGAACSKACEKSRLTASKLQGTVTLA